MNRTPGQNKGRPPRAADSRRRVEVWLYASEDAALTAHLGRQATAADVRELALAASTQPRAPVAPDAKSR